MRVDDKPLKVTRLKPASQSDTESACVVVDCLQEEPAAEEAAGRADGVPKRWRRAALEVLDLVRVRTVLLPHACSQVSS